MKFEFKNFIVQPCRARAAYEFIPKKKVEIDLEKLSKKLKENNYFLEADTPIILVLRIENKPISIFKHGKIMVRDSEEKEDAKRIIEPILDFFEEKQP